MITHKAASIFTPHNFSPNSLSHCLQYKLHKFQFSQSCRLTKSLQLRNCFSHQNWTDYGPDDNILGDCVVFEEGIFEQPQIISNQTKIISKEDGEEEEEESLIPEEWRELQTELNVPKRERKKRMQSIESANSFRRNREFGLSRDGLSENNTIKLPELNFTQSIKISDDPALEISSVEAGDSDNICVTEELTGISSVKDDSDESRYVEEENGEALRSFSVGETGIRSSQTSQTYSFSVRERNGQISCAEGESGKPLENLFVRDGILRPSLTAVSSSVSEGNDEIHSGNGVDKVKISSEGSVNARVLPRNPRLQVVGAGFEEISKRLDEEYKVEDDEENQPQERRQLFTPEEKVLLNKRLPDLQRATSAKWIPLHTFATAGQSYLLDFLLMHGVDVNAIDKDGQTALHKAITCKKEGIVNYLLKAGANALVRDRDGATLIHYAVEVSAIQTIKHLILYKVDIDVPDNYGWTPLHLAVQSRRTDVVRLLLIKGADKNIRNKDGNTPLDLCLHSGQDMRTYELIRLLKTFPKKTSPNSIPSQILR